MNLGGTEFYSSFCNNLYAVNPYPAESSVQVVNKERLSIILTCRSTNNLLIIVKFKIGLEKRTREMLHALPVLPSCLTCN